MDPRIDLGSITQVRDTTLAVHHGIQFIETNIRKIAIHFKALIPIKTIQDHLRGTKTCLTLDNSEFR